MNEVKKVGLQLYSLKDEVRKNLPGTLEKVAEMGYDGVEFFGTLPYPAREIRDLLERNRLEAAGYHVQLPWLEGDALRDTVRLMKELGVRNVIVAILPENRRRRKQDWINAAEYLNEIEPIFRDTGLRLGYHNHRVEFEPVEGEIPFDLLFSRLRRDIIMQIDVGHVYAAGENPSALLRKYPDRSLSVHIRDYSPGNEEVAVGDGNVDWREVLDFCDKVGDTEWYIVEQEGRPETVFQACERSLARLRVLLAAI